MSTRAKSHGLRCVICGTSRGVEKNHAGGKNHVAWFRMPLCLLHHRQFHILLVNAGVDLEYTSDKRERLRRAMKAIMICHSMLLEASQELDSRGTHKGGNNVGKPRNLRARPHRHPEKG